MNQTPALTRVEVTLSSLTSRRWSQNHLIYGPGSVHRHCQRKCMNPKNERDSLMTEACP